MSQQELENTNTGPLSAKVANNRFWSNALQEVVVDITVLIIALQYYFVTSNVTQL